MDNLRALMTKWKRETKTEPTLGRIQKAADFLKKHDLGPTDVRFENHLDPLWNQRKVRADHEKMAALIGYTNAKTAGGTWTRWWIVPKKAAIKAA